jgi:hypothetical protein
MVQLEKYFGGMVVINIYLPLVSSELVAVLEMSTRQFLETFHSGGCVGKNMGDQLE